MRATGLKHVTNVTVSNRG